MNPVAWINEEMQVMFLKDLADAYPTLWKPLYTHPVKELTDEEILESANKIHARIPKNIGNDFLLISFARAILRKAQEK
jgi:hypothetical protein